LEDAVKDQSFLSFCRGLGRIISARPRVPAGLEDNAMLATILERRSVREFKPEPIGEDLWQAILEAGRLAPSTVNLQTWSFAHFTAQDWRDFFDAPLPFGAARGVVVMSDVRRARRAVPGFPYAPLCEHTLGVMNASLAAMNMTLAAEALGLASVMLSETGRTGFYDARYLADKLELPAGVVPIMTIVFGHPAGRRPVMPPKHRPETVTFQGRYREAPQADLDRWNEEMRAGYRAAHGGEAFAAKIAYYRKRIGKAERDLTGMIHYEGPPGGGPDHQEG
jgi:nitroreductase